MGSVEQSEYSSSRLSNAFEECLERFVMAYRANGFFDRKMARDCIEECNCGTYGDGVFDCHAGINSRSISMSFSSINELELFLSIFGYMPGDAKDDFEGYIYYPFSGGERFRVQSVLTKGNSFVRLYFVCKEGKRRNKVKDLLSRFIYFASRLMELNVFADSHNLESIKLLLGDVVNVMSSSGIKHNKYGSFVSFPITISEGSLFFENLEYYNIPLGDWNMRTGNFKKFDISDSDMFGCGIYSFIRVEDGVDKRGSIYNVSIMDTRGVIALMLTLKIYLDAIRETPCEYTFVDEGSHVDHDGY